MGRTVRKKNMTGVNGPPACRMPMGQKGSEPQGQGWNPHLGQQPRNRALPQTPTAGTGVLPLRHGQPPSPPALHRLPQEVHQLRFLVEPAVGCPSVDGAGVRERTGMGRRMPGNPPSPYAGWRSYQAGQVWE